MGYARARTTRAIALPRESYTLRVFKRGVRRAGSTTVPKGRDGWGDGRRGWRRGARREFCISAGLINWDIEYAIPLEISGLPVTPCEGRRAARSTCPSDETVAWTWPQLTFMLPFPKPGVSSASMAARTLPAESRVVDERTFPVLRFPLCLWTSLDDRRIQTSEYRVSRIFSPSPSILPF